MRTLLIYIKREFFDKIASGEKKFEYRAMKPFWESRLINKQYEVIEFRAGYSVNAPRLTIEYLGYEIHETYPQGYFPEKQVFALKLGEIINVTQ